MKSNQAVFLRTAVAAPLAAISVFALSACGSSAAADSEWRSATSVEDAGGMEALIEAAQAEGQFNAMGLYEDWANYGGLLETFSEKYGITINNDVSTGSSQDLVNAVINRQGQDDSLDYLDTGLSFAVDAANDGLLAKYYPSNTENIPADMKDAEGRWYNHLGGNMAIGCDTKRVALCPESFADLLNPEYKNQVAIPGDPTTGESGFMVVYAAALANGGSLQDITPGLDFFEQLAETGNLLPVEANAGTIETGETPIVINWDYLLAPIAQNLADSGVDLQIHHPSDGTVSSYYAASINEDAPHPAVARLWMEFLFSDEGQNLLLEGFVKPIRLGEMIEQGSVNKRALDALPEGSREDAPQPSLADRESQRPIMVDGWTKAVG